jgi:hypothetical protein
MNKPRKSRKPRSGSRGAYLTALVLAALLLAPFQGATAAQSAPKVVYKVSKSADAKPADTKSVESEETEAKETETKGSEIKGSETKRAETQGGPPAQVAGFGGGETGVPSKPVYVYNPAGKTDPFKPFIAEQEEAEEPRGGEPRTYLETLELSQLDLIAIVETSNGNWAMVRDGKGIGYTIRKGTRIGVHGGVVEAIGGKEIVIRESHRDYKGKTTVKYVRKALPSPQ